MSLSKSFLHSFKNIEGGLGSRRKFAKIGYQKLPYKFSNKIAADPLFCFRKNVSFLAVEIFSGKKVSFFFIQNNHFIVDASYFLFCFLILLEIWEFLSWYFWCFEFESGDQFIFVENFLRFFGPLDPARSGPKGFASPCTSQGRAGVSQKSVRKKSRLSSFSKKSSRLSK